MNPLALRQALTAYLLEDIGHGDVTSESIFSADAVAVAVFIAKERFLVAGIQSVASEVFKIKNPYIEILSASGDGQWVDVGDMIFKIRGAVLDLLGAERVALNLAQRLCGIATTTARFVEAVKPLPVKISDTRKTTPGLRMVEKYAVRVGGGSNHRFSLADAILIKDNHIIASGSISKAVAMVRAQAPHSMRIEVEAETLSEVEECLACGVDIIMLDNMHCNMMRQAVELSGRRAILEASGGVTLANVRKIAETGVDIISIGALTHSAPACDISMELLKPEL